MGFLLKLGAQWEVVLSAGEKGLCWNGWVYPSAVPASLASLLYLSNDVRLNGHQGNQQNMRGKWWRRFNLPDWQVSVYHSWLKTGHTLLLACWGYCWVEADFNVCLVTSLLCSSHWWLTPVGVWKWDQRGCRDVRKWGKDGGYVGFYFI